MTGFVYGSCVGDWAQFCAYVAPRTEGRILMALSGQLTIAAAYNRILDWASEWHPGYGVVLVHADLEILDVEDAEEKLAYELTTGGASVVGVAGANGVTGLDWWTGAPVGHQLTDAQDIRFPAATGSVEMLEGSLLAFSPKVVKNWRFDVRFPGFHGYDELPYRMARSGHRLAVADIDTHHHNPMGYRTPQSAEQWQECNRLFKEKWGML